MAAVSTRAAEPVSAPLALHPDNGHYFLWRSKPTLLITSGEHYGAVLNLDFDYVQYLDELQARGLNHTRTFSGVYREDAASFQITHNTLAPSADRYLAPWPRSDQPGYRGGGNRFDLSRFDPAYFQRLKDFLAQASRRGIVVELTLFCPMYEDSMWNICPMNADNNVNGIGKMARDKVHTLEHRDLLDVQLAVTRKIVSELRDFDNLYYEVCNEPYFGGVTTPWQHAIADAIVDAEKPFPHKHLISMNVANGRAQVSDPHPAVSIFNFHYCVPPDTVGMNYSLNKAIGENETGFRGQADILYRTEAWDFILAGGGLYNNLDYSFTADHPAGTLRDYKSPGGGSRELREQLGTMKRFMDSFDFVKMRPCREIVKQVEPQLSVQMLGEPARAYALAMHVPLPNKPKKLEDHLQRGIRARLSLELPEGSYRCQWLDPVTGQQLGEQTVTAGTGLVELEPPAFDNEVVGSIRRL